jgi:hypothetical protein
MSVLALYGFPADIMTYGLKFYVLLYGSQFGRQQAK